MFVGRIETEAKQSHLIYK